MKIFGKKKKIEPKIEVGQEFFYAMEYVKRYLENESEPKNKIVFLDFVLEVIKNDLKYDLLAHIFYNQEHFKEKFRSPMPLFFWDEEGNEKSVSELGVDITETFPHIYADGRYWYNSHNNEKKGNVTDFRLAIIYEVAKMKYGLEK